MSTGKTYQVAEIFYSVQGEGAKSGTPSVFVRFAGCNLNCRVAREGFDCDTDHGIRFNLTADEIVSRAIEAGGSCRRVVFTGGEPTLQLDVPILDRFREAGYLVAIETNGTNDVPIGVDWITVSPKPGHTVRQRLADEVKIVLRDGQPLPDLSRFITRRIYLSPAADGKDINAEAALYCVRLCLENPELRLSLQVHKVAGVP